MIILILGFFVLGCNFNCKAMNEDFAPGYCKILNVNKLLCRSLLRVVLRNDQN